MWHTVSVLMSSWRLPVCNTVWCRQLLLTVWVRTQIDGLPRTAARSKYDLDGGAGAVSLLIRISHKVRP